MDKRLEGRDEPILDRDLPIIDAHHHLFARPALRYLLDDYLEDVRAGHRIVASVYVETLAFARTEGPELLRPMPEVEFANGVGAMTASGAFGDVHVCAAIIGHADMRLGDEVARPLDRCLETAPERFRGVRQITLEYRSEAPFRLKPAKPPVGVLQHPGFRQAFRHLASRGLVFDAAVFEPQLPDISSLADAFPDTTVTLNHMGMAIGLGLAEAERAELFKRWREALRELARPVAGQGSAQLC